MTEISIIRTVAEIVDNSSEETVDYLTLGVVTIKPVDKYNVQIIDDNTEEVSYIHNGSSENLEPSDDHDSASEHVSFETFLENIRKGVLKVPTCLEVDDLDTDNDDATTLFSLYLVWKVLEGGLTGKHSITFQDYDVISNGKNVGTLSHLAVKEVNSRFESIISALTSQ